jgi:hypothetical protein
MNQNGLDILVRLVGLATSTWPTRPPARIDHVVKHADQGIGSRVCVCVYIYIVTSTCLFTCLVRDTRTSCG